MGPYKSQQFAAYLRRKEARAKRAVFLLLLIAYCLIAFAIALFLYLPTCPK